MGRGRAGLPGRVAGKRVARGLQRVSAGPGISWDSRASGRLVPKTLPDLMNQGGARGRDDGRARRADASAAELPFDILAQQIVAMAAMETWKVDDLFRVVRQAYPFRDPTPQAFDNVLEMVTGRFRFQVDDDETPKTNSAHADDRPATARQLGPHARQAAGPSRQSGTCLAQRRHDSRYGAVRRRNEARPASRRT